MYSVFVIIYIPILSSFLGSLVTFLLCIVYLSSFLGDLFIIYSAFLSRLLGDLCITIYILFFFLGFLVIKWWCVFFLQANWRLLRGDHLLLMLNEMCEKGPQHLLFNPELSPQDWEGIRPMFCNFTLSQLRQDLGPLFNVTQVMDGEVRLPGVLLGLACYVLLCFVRFLLSVT